MAGRGKEGGGGGVESVVGGGRGDHRTIGVKDVSIKGYRDKYGYYRIRDVDGGIIGDGDGNDGTDKLVEGGGPGTGGIWGGLDSGGSHLEGGGPDP